MTYLLDVNAVVALGLVHHDLHGRVATWLGAEHVPSLATWSITEAGFLRMLAQAPSIVACSWEGPLRPSSLKGSGSAVPDRIFKRTQQLPHLQWRRRRKGQGTGWGGVSSASSAAVASSSCSEKAWDRTRPSEQCVACPRHHLVMPITISRDMDHGLTCAPFLS